MHLEPAGIPPQRYLGKNDIHSVSIIGLLECYIMSS